MEKMDYEETQEENESISDESEEESEIDDEQYEKNRNDLSDKVKEIEDAYNKLKQDLIQERLVMIEKKLQDIENETAKEYAIPLARLKQNMEMKLKVATLLRDYRLENVENSYQCEKKSTQQTLENDKHLLFDNLKSKIENEIQELEEKRKLLKERIKNHEKIDETIVSAQEMIIKKNTQSKSNDNLLKNSNKQQQQRKLFSSTEPYIVYSLNEYDIMEDWKLITQSVDSATTSTNSNSTCLTVN